MILANVAGMVAATVPGIVDSMSRTDWIELIEDFISQSTFENPSIIDIRPDFQKYIDQNI